MHPPSSEQPDNHIDIYECYARWNYVRVLSGAFYNLSGILYQAGRYAHAARFLEKACYLGSDCLAGFNTLKKDKGKPYEKDVEGWKTMQGQLYKRWEVLGVCHMKGGDRRVRICLPCCLRIV